jgi:predicted signal transduction protein with EAL and GGDEF domain
MSLSMRIVPKANRMLRRPHTWNPRRSLQMRHMLVTVLVVLPIVGLILITLAWMSTSILYAVAAEDRIQASGSAAHSIEQWDSDIAMALESVEETPDMASMDPDRQRPVIAAIKKTYGRIDIIRVTRPDGISIVRTDGTAPVNYADRNWFKACMNGMPIYRAVLITRTTKMPALNISIPIRDQEAGKVVGVLSAVTNLASMPDILGSSMKNFSCVNLLVDEHGRAMLHWDVKTAQTLCDLSQYPPVRQAIGGKPGKLDFTDSAGKSWLSTSVRLPNGWVLVTQTDRATAMARSTTMMRVIAGLALVAVISIAGSIFVITRRLLKPILKMTEAAEKLGAGEWRQQVPDCRNDEIGLLARTFNRMSAQLEEGYRLIEEKVAQRTAQLQTAALFDRLTGLPNRALLHDRLTQKLKQVARDRDSIFAVFFLDFDRFKAVNDSLGHEIGDLLLSSIGKRLSQAIRDIDTVTGTHTTAQAGSPAVAASTWDTVGRLGGDEFIILLDELRSPLDAARVANRILESLATPHDMKGHIVHITASIGITTSAVGYTSADVMIRDADTAMYRAKAEGKSRFVIFDQQMHTAAMERLTLENDLRRAVDRNELILEYQPIVSLQAGVITGFEALLRWRHPGRGIIPPLDFIPLAEETGLIVPIGYWVLEQAASQLMLWRERHAEFAGLFMSVNLSRKQLAIPDLAQRVGQILRKCRIDPRDIWLEITENVVIGDLDHAIVALDELRQLGVQLQLDDFGTGYSSLSCLPQLPIRGLKIDKAFVRNIVGRKDHVAVIEAIVSLANNLGIQIVAEGIETAEQAVLLRGLGCQKAQGYLFSKPLSPNAAEAFVLHGGASSSPTVSAA